MTKEPHPVRHAMAAQPITCHQVQWPLQHVRHHLTAMPPTWDPQRCTAPCTPAFRWGAPTMRLLRKPAGSSSGAVGARVCRNISTVPPYPKCPWSFRAQKSLRTKECIRPCNLARPPAQPGSHKPTHGIDEAGIAAAGHDTSCDCSHARGRRRSKTGTSQTRPVHCKPAHCKTTG